MRQLSIITFVLLMVLAQSLPAQKVTYQVEHFSVDDGLPNHWVLSLLQHSSGFLWVGTTQGLCRFDGYEFATILPKGLLPNAFTGSVRGLYELANGEMILHNGPPSLRVGDRTFYRYQPTTNIAIEISEEVYHSTIEKEQLAAPNSDIHVQENITEEGILNLTTTDKYGNKLVTLSRSRVPKEASLILATGERLDLSTEWKTLYTAATSVSKNFGDVIYWGGHNGLLKISIRRSPFDLILYQKAEEWEYRTICRAMIELNDDSILISTEKNGEAIYNKNTQMSSYITWVNEVGTKFVDANAFRNISHFGFEGHFIGVKWSNVLRMNILDSEMKNHIPSQSKTLASSILGDSKYLVARRKTGVYEYFIEIHDLITKISQNFEPEHGRDVLLTARPTYIFPTSDSTIWYCTKSGLFDLDIKNNEIRHLYLSRDAEAKSYDIPVSYQLSGPHVWVVHDSGDGLVWIGMDGDGLNVLNTETAQVEYLTTIDGLPNNTVVGILPDSTGYWISTFKGLSHFDTASSQFQNFYHSNGTAHDEFNRFSFMRDSDGKFYFGSMNGITSFYPDDVLGRPADLKLMVSEISHYDKKGNEIVARGSEEFKSHKIDIPSNNRFLSIKMCLSDFNYPDGNTFFYFLEKDGVLQNNPTQNWSALGMNHELRFENLEAGKYKLHLRGVSALGAKSDEVMISIQVNQFFYKTWWFISAIILALISGLYSLHVLRLRQAMKMEKLRTRLSSDLHDDVGGLLSGIALQMDALGYSIGAEHKSLVKRIAHSSRSAMEKMRDVVWAIDAREGHIRDLKARMLESAEEVLSPLDIMYTINVSSVSDHILLPSEIRHNFLLIFKEFANNTVKHADASRVDVKFNKTGKVIGMVIRDDGVGFDAESNGGTGQGIRNMIMRTEQMHGRIEFLKEKGFGVSVQVPLK